MQPFARDHREEIKLNTCIKQIVEQQARDDILKGSTKEMCDRNDKEYYKTNTRISIEHPHSLQLMILLSIPSQHIRFK
jgi:hypothetical protein